MLLPRSVPDSSDRPLFRTRGEYYPPRILHTKRRSATEQRIALAGRAWVNGDVVTRNGSRLAAAKTTGSAPMTRTMSAAARRKIAAAQRRRWPKFRAARRRLLRASGACGTGHCRLSPSSSLQKSLPRNAPDHILGLQRIQMHPQFFLKRHLIVCIIHPASSKSSSRQMRRNTP